MRAAAALPAVLLALSPALLHAQDAATGARARALGGASTAFSDDPHAVWINPAGTAAQPGGFAISYDTYPLYEEQGDPIRRAPARIRVNDPVFLPSFFGLVYQIGSPELPQALGLGLATPHHLHQGFRGPDPATPGTPPDLTIEQTFTRLRLSYGIDLALRPRDTHGFLTHLALGVGLDLATTRFESTTPPDNENSPVDHALALSGGVGVQLGLFDNGENFRATFGVAYQGPAAFNLRNDQTIPFYDWPQQVQVGVALYLLDRLPLRILLEFQWTDWRTAAQESQLAGLDGFSPASATSFGAEYRIDLSPSVGLLPRVGMKYATATWSHHAKADLPAWGHFQLYLDSRSSSFLVFSMGVGLTWGYAEGTQDTLDLAFDIGGDSPGLAISYTFQF